MCSACSKERTRSVLPRSRARSLAAAALGLLLSMGVALPACASPATPDPLSAQPVGTAQRLAKEAAASGIESTLRAALGTSFAGAWFEPGTSDLIVATTDSAAAASVRAAGAQPRLVSRDLLALDRVMAVLESRAGSVYD